MASGGTGTSRSSSASARTSAGCWLNDRAGRTIALVSDPARADDGPHGTSLLPRDLTDVQFNAAPTLASSDVLLIEGLSQDEDDAFAAALAE